MKGFPVEISLSIFVRARVKLSTRGDVISRRIRVVSVQLVAISEIALRSATGLMRLLLLATPYQ